MKAQQEELYRVHGWEQPVHCLHRHISPTDGTRAHALHYHDYIELLYGLEGEARVLIADRAYTMAEGDLLVVNAGEPHDVVAAEGESRYFVVKFLPELLYSQGKSLHAVRYLLSLWQSELSFAPALRAEELSGSGIDGWIGEIMREWDERSAGYELIIHAAILRVFVWVLRARIPIPNEETVLPPALRVALESALSEAQAHIYTPWTAEQAAARCNLSYSYFSRSFKAVYGVSFSSYLESLRLREAERLLLTTDRGVTDIAAALGFGTTSYFIERFRRRYGVSPRRYRQRVQSGGV